MGWRNKDQEGPTESFSNGEPVPSDFWKEGMLCQKKKM